MKYIGLILIVMNALIFTEVSSFAVPPDGLHWKFKSPPYHPEIPMRFMNLDALYQMVNSLFESRWTEPLTLVQKEWNYRQFIDSMKRLRNDLDYDAIVLGTTYLKRFINKNRNLEFPPEFIPQLFLVAVTLGEKITNDESVWNKGHADACGIESDHFNSIELWILNVLNFDLGTMSYAAVLADFEAQLKPFSEKVAELEREAMIAR